MPTVIRHSASTEEQSREAERRRALQLGPAGEFGQGRDETGGITTGEPLRLVSREEQPVWQRGRKQEPPRPSRAP